MASMHNSCQVPVRSAPSMNTLSRCALASSAIRTRMLADSRLVDFSAAAFS
jgi:hypothetical protein